MFRKMYYDNLQKTTVPVDVVLILSQAQLKSHTNMPEHCLSTDYPPSMFHSKNGKFKSFHPFNILYCQLLSGD